MSVFGSNELFAGFEESDAESYDDSDNDWEELNRCREENNQLRTENEELRKALRIITQPSRARVLDELRDGPVAQVLLFNSSLARQEKEQIEGFFQQVVSQRLQDSDCSVTPQLCALRCPPPRRSKAADRKVSRAYTITDSVQFYAKQFCLDMLGEPLSHNGRLCRRIPEYERAYLDALDGKVEAVESDRNKAKRSCFNCGLSDHQLKDCPIPKDFKAINQRKQKFLGNMAGSPAQSGSNRYHADIEEDDPRFARYKPGAISDELRLALGMSEFSLPPYIYQMRLMGYPPGHMEEAKVAGSGLSFYSGRNKKAQSDQSAEEGLVDVTKFIAYPGFNVKPDRRVKDEHQELGMMPMDERHSLDIMTSYHRHLNETLKRKAETSSGEAKRRKTDEKKDDTTEMDMDTSDDGGPNVQEESVVVVDDEEAPQSVPDVTIATTNISSEEEGELTGDSGGVEALESPCVISSECEDGELTDGVDTGDLDEEQLQIKRAAILRKLKMHTGGRFSPGHVVDLTSDASAAENADEDPREFDEVDGDSPDSHLGADQSFPIHEESECIYVDEEFTEEEVSEELQGPGGATSRTDAPVCESPSSPEMDVVVRADEEAPLSSQEDNSIDISTDRRKSPQSPPSSPCHVISETAAFSPPLQTEALHPPPDLMRSSNEERPGAPLSMDESRILLEAPADEDQASQLTDEEEAPPSPDSPPPPSPHGRKTPTSHPADGADEDPPAHETSSQSLSTAKDEVETPPVDVTGDSPLIDAGPGVPHRSKFAKGINEFGMFQEETKSRGVYSKLRTLLKNSPRRTGKNT